MQKPEQVVAFLLDKGNGAFVKRGDYGDPWSEIIAALVSADIIERAGAFERALMTLESPEPVRRLVQEELEERFSRRRESAPAEVPPALLDSKPQLDEAVLAQGLQDEEDGDAMVAATLYHGQIAYDHSQRDGQRDGRGWHLWNGQYWEEDGTRAVINLIRTEVAAQYLNAAVAYTRADQDDVAKRYMKRAERLHTQRRKEHVLWAAAALPQIALTGDEWDANPWLLGTRNGVIDLKTGEFRPGRPTDWIKTVTPTPWDGIDAPCPRWEQFICEIFGGNQDLMGFVHRLLGYGITGLSDEHAFPVLWGAMGRNGKTTMLETLGAILGQDMTMSIPANELMRGYGSGSADTPRPFIYKLRGKRLVWSSETNPDRRLDAETVKLLTGGDTIHVRSMYTTPIEFRPSHLLLLLTNFRPQIESADNAVWDRVYLIPFDQRFVDNPQKENEHPRDKQLNRKLTEERSGILAWLVRGCLEWQNAGGLKPPAIVSAATADYRSEEDTISQFVDEYCLKSPSARTGHRELYREYVRWCKDLRLWASGSRDFGVALRARFDTRKMNTGVTYMGIGLPLGGATAGPQLSLEDESSE